MASLAVLTGATGAGKSTVARALADSFGQSVLVAGDAFLAYLARGAIAPWLPAAHGQNGVVMRAAAATGRFVAGGFMTVYDGVLGPWFLADFAAEAAEAALDHLHHVILLPSAERCVDQVASCLDRPLEIGRSMAVTAAGRAARRSASGG